MRTSKNQYGQIEAYTDEGQFVGILPPDYPGLERFAEDGGPGSGNHGHAGRPGQVGGSAPSGGGAKTGNGKSSSEPIDALSEFGGSAIRGNKGSGMGAKRPDLLGEVAPYERLPEKVKNRFIKSGHYKVSPKAIPVGGKSHKTESGERYAKEFEKKYNESPESADYEYYKEHGYWGKHGLLGGIYMGLDWGSITGERLFHYSDEELLDHYKKVLIQNGAPTLADGKKKESEVDHNERSESKGDRNARGFVPEEFRLKYLKTEGFSEEEAKEIDKCLIEYTAGDWKKVDQDVLDQFIKKSTSVAEGDLYRGISVNEDEFDMLMESLKSGVISFGSVVSWTSKKGIAIDFSHPDYWDSIGNYRGSPGDNHSVIFHIADGANRSGVPIDIFSKFGEREKITPRNAQYSVLAVYTAYEVSGESQLVKKATIVDLIERGAEYDE